MATIIYPAAWHPQKVVSLQELRARRQSLFPKEGHPDEVALPDIDFYSACEDNRVLIRKALECGNAMVAYIGSMFSGFSLHSRELMLRQQEFKTIPLEALSLNVLSSESVLWEHKPNYYGALFLEFTRRATAVEQYMRKLNNPHSS